jgi:hypothetical protein
MLEIIVLLVACVVIATIVVHVLRQSKVVGVRNEPSISEVKSRVPPISISIGLGTYEQSDEDRAFENVILNAQTLPIEKFFYTKLVGTSHDNDDGSSRVKAISDCHVGANLGMRLEPENKFDPNAIAIMFDNRQLGYLDARLAGETTRDIKRNGFRYGVYLRRPTLHPTTNRIVGAVLLMIRFTKESAIKLN